jgi:hypothetical protein
MKFRPSTNLKAKTLSGFQVTGGGMKTFRIIFGLVVCGVRFLPAKIGSLDTGRKPTAATSGSLGSSPVRNQISLSIRKHLRLRLKRGQSHPLRMTSTFGFQDTGTQTTAGTQATGTNFVKTGFGFHLVGLQLRMVAVSSLVTGTTNSHHAGSCLLRCGSLTLARRRMFTDQAV